MDSRRTGEGHLSPLKRHDFSDNTAIDNEGIVLMMVIVKIMMVVMTMILGRAFAYGKVALFWACWASGRS